MRLLFDTNILLDVLLDRKPHGVPAARLLSAAERGAVEGYVCATSLTTLFYLMSKAANTAKAKKALGMLLRICSIAPVDYTVLKAALSASFPDFEDAVIHEAALHAGAEAIVTRDSKGFRAAALPIYTPLEALELFSENS